MVIVGVLAWNTWPFFAGMLFVLAVSALICWEDPLHPAGIPGGCAVLMIGTAALFLLLIAVLGGFTGDDC